MLPFPALKHAIITAEKVAVYRCRNFGSSVPFGLLQSDDVTTLCSLGSQQVVAVADTVYAVDRCCANVERAERELLQPRSRPDGLVFLAGGLTLRPLPPSLFPSKYPPIFTQFQVFSTRFLPSSFRRVGYGTSTTHRLLHRRHFCVLAYALRAFLLSSLRVPHFPRRRCPNFATAGMVAAGNDFAFSCRGACCCSVIVQYLQMSTVQQWDGCLLDRSPSLRIFFSKGQRATILGVVDDHMEM